MLRGLVASVLLGGCTATSPSPTPAGGAASPLRSRIARVPRGAFVAPAATATASARALVTRLAAERWDTGELAELQPRGEIAVGGGTLVRLEQQIDGLPVEAGELHVLVEPSGALVAASGVPIPAGIARDVPRFTVSDVEAIARAVAAVAPATRVQAGPGRSRVRRVWHRDGDGLVAAWLVEAYLEDGDAVRVVTAASDGRVLARRSLVEADAFAYRVWADGAPDFHPHDSPNADFVPYPHPTLQDDYPGRLPSALVTVQGANHPAGGGSSDPWLPAGATETNGNNIDAYDDLNAPDGLTAGDFRASVTAPGIFDRSYDFTQGPLVSPDQQKASITALFFTLNYMHDFWYDAGLVETAGNAQASNYGRGGIEGDVLHAEAQDSANDGQRNNANMTTPDDGMSPRMQVYVWTGADHHTFTAGGKPVTVSTAGFGPGTYTVTGALVADTTGCSALGAAASGKVALVERGTCSFKQKAANAQAAGAIGLVIADNQASSTPPPLGDDTTITTAITIAVMGVSQADGAALRAELASGATPVTMARQQDPDLDGSLDATVIAHEHGHYLHHRLSQCNTTMCGAMSEGWADFSALMMTARAGDDFVHGAFPLAQYATRSFPNPGYFGIRRVPYSADLAIDPLTFIDMAAGQALPTTAPLSGGGGANSEVHNAGEIWATMLWDVYTQVQAEVGDFDAARTRMAKDVVAGLLLAPPDATPTEMRDALIAAAGAAVPGDDRLFATAFARRGLGSCAIPPARDSVDFTGIVESTILDGNPVLSAAVVADASCMADQTLDSGQSATLTVALDNAGFDPVDGVAVAVTSATPGLTVTVDTADVGTLAPGDHRELMLVAHYDAGSGSGTPVAGEIDVHVTATNGCNPNIVQKVPLRLDVDDTIDGERDDHFDTARSAWTASSATAWQHVHPTALDGAWHGADLGQAGTSSLASPPLDVDGDRDFTVTFTHRYSFEYSNATAWDGGVIEVSTDDGATWVDVSTLASPGYGPDKLGDQAGNPLAGRVGYTHQNPSYPATDEVTLAFGRKLAGKTVRLRFAVGTDQAQSAAGWDIDDVLISGISNGPFGAARPSTGTCEAHGILAPEEGAGCCNAAPLSRGTVAAFALVGGLLLRRRRRRLVPSRAIRAT